MMKRKTPEETKQLAETIGAIQDTLRVHADSLEAVKDHIYAMIISLDLIFMDLDSSKPVR